MEATTTRRKSLMMVDNRDELQTIHDALVEYEAKLSKQTGSSAYRAIERRASKLRVRAASALRGLSS